MNTKYLFLAKVFLLLSSLCVTATTYTATNTNDSGPVSLHVETGTRWNVGLGAIGLDPTFSGDGILTDSFGPGNAVAIQPDGKIVAAAGCCGGHGSGNFTIARYNANGSPDTTFGGGLGYVATDIGSNWLDEVRAVVVQPDGRIVAAGSTSDCGEGGCTITYWAIVRYNPDGTLDTSFGGDGIVSTSTGSTSDAAFSIAIQPDGKFVVGGTNGLGDFAVIRLNTDGSFDTTFDGDGIVTTPVGAYGDFAYSVAIQTDGKIVAAGHSYNGPGSIDSDIAIARYNPDGSLDTTFNSDGKVTTPIGSSDDVAHSVAVQPDGKLVAGGWSYIDGSYGGWDLALVRYNADGSLDTTFDSDGKVTMTLDSSAEKALAVAIQTDGKIVAAGFMLYELQPFVYSSPIIARFNADGSVDHWGFIDVGGWGLARGVALDRLGRAVIVGESGSLLIARYLLSPLSRTRFDFDGDRRSDISVFRPTDSVWYLNQSSDGFFATQFGLPTDKIAPADYDGDGKTDIAVFRDGTWWLRKSADGAVQTIQFGVAGDVPAPADYTGDGRDELAVYRNGQWWALDLTNNQPSLINFGVAGDKPVPADFDGDGRVDQAVYRNGEWHINRSTLGLTIISWGLPNDRPVVGDYDGDGKADPAVYRDGTWYAFQSSAGWYELRWGLSTDVPVPADYDGDGKTDAAVFRQGTWYLLGSTGGIFIQQFGLTGDQPLQASFIR